MRFETTGDLSAPGTDKSPPISADGEKALYDAIRNGKGFLAMHCGADTFGHFPPRDKGREDPYVQMVGGEFVSHGPQQVARIEIVDPEFPGLADGFAKSGKSFQINDEWYALKNMPDDLHVILVQVTDGMKSGPKNEYERPNYPITWARNFGKGRVFYTSMGHREDVWSNPMYQGLLLGALGWATGRRGREYRAQHPQGHTRLRSASRLSDSFDRKEPALAHRKSSCKSAAMISSARWEHALI